MINHYHQYAVLWTVAGRDGEGNPTLNNPVEIRCRWEDGSREIRRSDGTIIAVDATVYVDRSIAVDSILCRGRLDDVGDSPTNLNRVAYINTIPDIRNQHVNYELLLVRHNNTLPSLA